MGCQLLSKKEDKLRVSVLLHLTQLIKSSLWTFSSFLFLFFIVIIFLCLHPWHRAVSLLYNYYPYEIRKSIHWVVQGGAWKIKLFIGSRPVFIWFPNMSYLKETTPDWPLYDSLQCMVWSSHIQGKIYRLQIWKNNVHMHELCFTVYFPLSFSSVICTYASKHPIYVCTKMFSMIHYKVFIFYKLMKHKMFHKIVAVSS